MKMVVLENSIQIIYFFQTKCYSQHIKTTFLYLFQSELALVNSIHLEKKIFLSYIKRIEYAEGFPAFLIRIIFVCFDEKEIFVYT